jgi:hypothetical protein
MNFIKTTVGKVRNLYTKTAKAINSKREALAVLVLMVSSQAHATGLIDAVTNFTTLFNGVKTLVVAVFAVVGLCAEGYAGKLMWDKGGERGDDIKVSKIMFCILGGAVCLAITYFGVLTLQTAGGSAADIGRTQ